MLPHDIYMFFSFHKSMLKLTYSKLEHFFLLQTTFNDLTGNLTIYRVTIDHLADRSKNRV